MLSNTAPLTKKMFYHTQSWEPYAGSQTIKDLKPSLYFLTLPPIYQTTINTPTTTPIPQKNEKEKKNLPLENTGVWPLSCSNTYI